MEFRNSIATTGADIPQEVTGKKLGVHSTSPLTYFAWMVEYGEICTDNYLGVIPVVQN